MNAFALTSYKQHALIENNGTISYITCPLDSIVFSFTETPALDSIVLSFSEEPTLKSSWQMALTTSSTELVIIPSTAEKENKKNSEQEFFW